MNTSTHENIHLLCLHSVVEGLCEFTFHFCAPTALENDHSLDWHFLRSTMSQDCLNYLAIMSIESDITKQLDYSDVIDEFAKLNAKV